MTDDEKFAEALRAAVAPGPPDVPREEMWARIQQRRRVGDPVPTRGTLPTRATLPTRGTLPTRATLPSLGTLPVRGTLPARGRRAELMRWALPLAATLVLGIALGRMSAADRASPAAFAEAMPTGDRTDSASPPALAFVLATVQHLARTEELLTALPGETRDSASGGVAAWASDLLTNTRLLMESPASADPQLAALLRDLELILVQIAALPPAAPAAELQLIEDGIERNDMIGRLRAATNERPIFGT
jgi:hypothetical protein